MCDLGDKHYYGIGVEQNYAEAVKWYREAAMQGNSYAQNGLANCYYYGYGVERDMDKAYELMKNSF